MSSKERTRGTVPFLHRTSRQFVKPPALPRGFLYFGPGLYLGHIDALITQRGTRVHHTHSVACPCNGVERYGGTGFANPACSACHGLGVAFIEDATTELRALVSDIDEREADGMPEGSVRVTPPSGFIMAPGDRLIFPDVVVPIAWMRKYRASVRGMRVPFDVLDVEAIATKGQRPESPLIPLIKGKDYTLNPDKRLITFPEGSRVRDGMVVSASFMGIPDYVVTENTKHFRSQLDSLEDDANVIQLPKYVYAARADILIGLRHKEVVGSGDASG